MTCLILIITATLIVLAADDAVTLENRIYGGIEKIHELSNDPPISIMIYGNSEFCNIPLENIISEYKKKTDFKKIDTVVKVKKDLLNFINKSLKSQKIEKYLNEELKQFKLEIKNDLDNINLKKITLEKEKIQKIKEFETVSLTFEDILPNNLTKKELELLNNNLEYVFLKI